MYVNKYKNSNYRDNVHVIFRAYRVSLQFLNQLQPSISSSSFRNIHMQVMLQIVFVGIMSVINRQSFSFTFSLTLLHPLPVSLTALPVETFLDIRIMHNNFSIFEWSKLPHYTFNHATITHNQPDIILCVQDDYYLTMLSLKPSPYYTLIQPHAEKLARNKGLEVDRKLFSNKYVITHPSVPKKRLSHLLLATDLPLIKRFQKSELLPRK